jgi:hypothetical protein
VHARLNATDVRVQHTVGDRSDAEIATEIELIRHKLATAQKPDIPLIEAVAEPVDNT